MDIGCGLITCDRPDFYQKSVTSLLHSVQEIKMDYIIINDGNDKLPFYPPYFSETKGREGVAKAKNIALKTLLDNGCEHIFLMEDDIEIIDSQVFDLYINASKSTGLKHFNYGLHGNHNIDLRGNPSIRKTVTYLDQTQIDLYPNLLGAFSYYHRSVLEDIGLFDEGYYNAMEHVKHTYDASLKGYTTPWRWFADVNGSSKYLKDIVPDHKKSIIRENKNFQEIFKKGLDRFIEQTGFSVVQGYGSPEPVITEKECFDFMRNLYKEINKNG